MTSSGILLVLVSACLHASWNLLSKSVPCSISFLTKALWYSTLIYFPLFLYLQTRVTYTSPYTLCMLGSGIAAGGYFFSLAKAYQYGQVSLAYPIARSFPILVVTWAGLFLGERPSQQGVAGILLVVCGCFFLPWKRFCLGPDGFCLRNYLNKSAFWALSAALFTSVYSVIDKKAATTLGSLPMTDAMCAQVNYVYLQNAISLGIMLACLKWIKLPMHPAAKRRAILAGVIFLVSYSLILAALTHNPAAYVVSFRQISIVLTSIISMLFLERDFSWPRLAGVIIIFSGILLIGLS